jgi:NADH pyrophosphatase NudC (nudix superfamily)
LTIEQITGSLVLEKDEKVLKAWQGDVESTVKTVRSKKGVIRTKHKVVEAKDKENGALVLTNERLIWLKSRGMFSKSYHTAFEVPLQDITGISETGTFGKRICVSDREGEYRFRIGATLQDFKTLVQNALTERKRALEEMRKKERVHVMIDFSSLKDYMEKGGLSLTTVKCPECNAPLKLPKDGTEIVCQYCNNTIHAQDIFEKIKSLI